MKSIINNVNIPFTIEDFEKGLVLAGLVTPVNVEELAEIEMLKDYDKQQAKERAITYFKRAVLGAEIVNNLLDENTFGRVKFQKLVYLCEHACEMKLQKNYKKFAAGPFDNKFMHSINEEFKRQRWFKITIDRSQGYNKPIYSLGDNVEKYKTYYSKYFGQESEIIHQIIELFRKTKTRDVELVATIYYCLLELAENKQLRNKKTLLDSFYKFADSKKKFSESEVINSFDWMKKNDIFPLL
ncbi:hypothetical protein UMM65_17155 [Aureibaculum sp. 2210JD6-5]|uniref:hypothetical protein n=1 Tax=Aureibaculum sp. 2210JD6-5 TaxID=3103957 RepID=UPI002AAE4D8B|nr:hypothetical protein [Aureibaculum sp. 2210JD6-5]MDY7396977.1 hypothetical protein [Aureibaculum sp. 2210JD6-5]